MLSNEMSLALYLSVFIMSAFLMYCAERKRDSVAVRRICITLSVTLPVMIAAFRACGTDIYTYASSYNRILNEPLKWFWQQDGSFEVTFTIINKIARRLDSIRLMLGTCALITLLPVYKSIWDKKDTIHVGYAALVFILLFYPTSFNIIRQYMAIGIVCISYKYIFDRKPVKFGLCILIAFSCHSSAIAFVPAYFLWTKDGDIVNDWRLWSVLAITLLLSLSLDRLMGSGLFAGDLERFEGYLDSDSGGRNRDFILNALVMVLLLPLMKQLNMIDKKNKFYYVMLIMQCIIGITGFNSPFIKRVGLYYGISEVFILGAIPCLKMENKTKKMIKTILIIYIIGRFVLVDYILNQPKIIPYKWVFPSWLGL